MMQPSFGFEFVSRISLRFEPLSCYLTPGQPSPVSPSQTVTYVPGQSITDVLGLYQGLRKDTSQVVDQS